MNIDTIIIVASIALLAIIVIVTVFVIKKNPNIIEKVKIKGNVRYTKDKEVVKDGKLNITLNEGDFLLECKKKYVVNKKSLLPGKYTALSADKNSEAFNLRIGGIVREYKHNTEIVLSEGDEISAVSHNVILR